MIKMRTVKNKQEQQQQHGFGWKTRRSNQMAFKDLDIQGKISLLGAYFDVVTFERKVCCRFSVELILLFDVVRHASFDNLKSSRKF